MCKKYNIILLAKTQIRALAKLGQSEPSTQCCLKWAEYHYWPLLAKLGRVKVLAKLGQSGPSTELAGFKYQAQNIFFFTVCSEFDVKNQFLFFSSWRFRAHMKTEKNISCISGPAT